MIRPNVSLFPNSSIVLLGRISPSRSAGRILHGWRIYGVPQVVKILLLGLLYYSLIQRGSLLCFRARYMVKEKNAMLAQIMHWLNSCMCLPCLLKRHWLIGCLQSPGEFLLIIGCYADISAKPGMESEFSDATVQITMDWAAQMTYNGTLSRRKEHNKEQRYIL